MGRGGAVGWTVTGPHKTLFLPAVYRKTTDNLFSISLSWLVGSGDVTENVSRLNQVFHILVRDEAGYLSNDCFRREGRGVRRKTGE